MQIIIQLTGTRSVGRHKHLHHSEPTAMVQWPDLLLRVPHVFVRLSARRLFIQIHVFSWVSCPSKQMLGYSVT